MCPRFATGCARPGGYDRDYERTHIYYVHRFICALDEGQRCVTVRLEWIERAVHATGAARIRRRRLPAEQVVWLVIALAMYRHWSISEVLDSLDLALPNEAAPFVSGSAVAQARQRIGEAPLAWPFEQQCTVTGLPSLRPLRGLG